MNIKKMMMIPAALAFMAAINVGTANATDNNTHNGYNQPGQIQQTHSVFNQQNNKNQSINSNTNSNQNKCKNNVEKKEQ